MLRVSVRPTAMPLRARRGRKCSSSPVLCIENRKIKIWHDSLSRLTSRVRSNYGRVIYPHYVWVIVAVISVMQMVGTSIRMAFGVFIEPLEQTFQWSQGSITLAYAISSVVTALASPFAGWFGDRFGARKAMTVGTAMFLLGMLLTGFISTIWELYLYFGVLLGVAQAIFLVPLIPSAMYWFRRHLGIGMGLIMASWGLGPALAAVVVSLLLEGMGWQNGFIALGIGSAAIMFVLIGLFRDTPADKGIQPYGHRPGDAEVKKRKSDPERTKAFPTAICGRPRHSGI